MAGATNVQDRNEIAFSERWVLFMQTTRKPQKYKGFIHIFIRKAIDPSKTLWGINSTSSLVILQSLALCFRLNFIILKLVYWFSQAASKTF